MCSEMCSRENEKLEEKFYRFSEEIEWDKYSHFTIFVFNEICVFDCQNCEFYIIPTLSRK